MAEKYKFACLSHLYVGVSAFQTNLIVNGINYKGKGKVLREIMSGERSLGVSSSEEVNTSEQ